jgi:hypothetical protein
MKRLFAVVLFAIAGCKKPAEAVGTPEARSAQGGDAGDAAWAPARVKAFVGYQRGMLALLVPPLLADGGYGKPSIKTDEDLARAEDKLRKASGLSDAEIGTMNTLAAALYTRHVMLKVTEATSLAGELEKARAELPDASVPEIDRALAAATEAQKRAGHYEQERARFGDALVDAALPFEQELLANFGAMMNSAHELGEAREDEH